MKIKNKLVFVGGCVTSYAAGIVTVPIVVDRILCAFAKDHPENEVAQEYLVGRDVFKTNVKDIFNGSYEHKRTLREFDRIVEANQLDL